MSSFSTALCSRVLMLIRNSSLSSGSSASCSCSSAPLISSPSSVSVSAENMLWSSTPLSLPWRPSACGTEEILRVTDERHQHNSGYTCRRKAFKCVSFKTSVNTVRHVMFLKTTDLAEKRCNRLILNELQING